MSSSLSIFNNQAVGYEQWILNNWDSLEGWEREQYRSFVAFATDQKRVKKYVAPPDTAPGPRASSIQESLLGQSNLPRTVSLAYALIFAGFFFFPMIFLPVAVGLGLINIGRRRWDHGLMQFVLVGAVVAFNIYGLPILAENYPGVHAFLVKYR